jgi:hypothetical protein
VRGRVQRVPPELAADLAGAFAAERDARTAVRAAVRRQTVLLWRLREGGVPFTAAALARALGEAASPEVRRRLAARLRQRIRRATALVTERHVELKAGCPRAESARLPWGMAANKEIAMPNGKLIKRVITEETYETADVEAEIDAQDEADEIEDDGDEDEPSPRKRRR